MAVRSRKATFSLHEDVLDALDEAIAQGGATSRSEFVERALLRELKRQGRANRWQEAANDPLFRRDIKEIEAAFRTADEESARNIQ